jgi:CRP/FNR family cyclic AMP-dependent transcriptional regulator
VTKYTLGFSKRPSYGAFMRTPDEKIELLRRLPTFRGAGRRELRAVAAAADVTTADAGRVLCRADRRALETYVVIDGEVDVLLDGTTVATLRRGDIVGELGMIDGEPRSADVVAVTDVRLLAIPVPAAKALIETSHSFRMALLRQLADRLRAIDLDLATRDAQPVPAA